jgi:hypothetical protein
VLRKIFGPKRDEVIGWRKLHNLYCLPMRMRWAGHVARMGEENAYRILVGKLEGKRPLATPRCRWDDDNRMDLR